MIDIDNVSRTYPMVKDVPAQHIGFTKEELCGIQYAVKLFMPASVKKTDISEKIERYFETLGDIDMMGSLVLIDNISKAWRDELKATRDFYWAE